MGANPIVRMTREEYLAIERKAQVKSEFFNGEMFAMSGGTANHSRVKGDLFIQLGQRLPKGCEIFDSDMRVEIPALAFAVYPDMSVVCGKPAFVDDGMDSITNPVVVVEALSPSTESNDRGFKFQHYREIPSLRDYILLSQHDIVIEQFSRAEDGKWVPRTYTRNDDLLVIGSIGVSIPIAEIYRRVEFSEPITGSREVLR